MFAFGLARVRAHDHVAEFARVAVGAFENLAALHNRTAQSSSFAELAGYLKQHNETEARLAFMRTATAQCLAVKAPDNLASLLNFFDRAERRIVADLLSRVAVDRRLSSCMTSTQSIH